MSKSESKSKSGSKPAAAPGRVGGPASPSTPGRGRRVPDRNQPVLPGPDEPGAFDPHMPGVDYGLLDGLMGYAVRRAQIALTADFVASLQKWDITPPRFAAMVLIQRNAGLKLTELARIMGIARSGVVMLVDTLQQLGYAERQPSPGDKRAYSLCLTPAGRRLLGVIEQAVAEHDLRMTRALNDGERRELMRLLDKLAAGG